MSALRHVDGNYWTAKQGMRAYKAGFARGQSPYSPEMGKRCRAGWGEAAPFHRAWLSGWDAAALAEDDSQ
ncbi:hypothetical protein LCGC14_2079290 [marine sediment metagenome]|uniref:Ribosome modulation factor n=1 Tax=marine sediment metagenome TaxID=412755 RepID=A0A0F9EFY4_9ZZZZ